MIQEASTKSDQAQVPPLWRNFLEDKVPASRNLLIEQYMPFVRKLAVQIYRRLPNHVELDDLISSGVFGLIDAISSYDPHLGHSFESFSNKRIRGAMLDELRKTDWLPRLLRMRIREYKEAVNTMHCKHGHGPNSDQVDEQLSRPGWGSHHLPVECSTRWLSLDVPSSGRNREEELTMVASLKDKSSVDPMHLAQQKDVRKLIARSLSQNEQLVILLYYYECMTMDQIGKTLGLCESRISQIHANTLSKLRNVLAERQEELQPPHG